MTWLIWLPLVASLVLLMVLLSRLKAKANRLNSQTVLLVALQSRFMAKIQRHTIESTIHELPELAGAKASRRKYLRDHAKKRNDKQRRLVSRLKN